MDSSVDAMRFKVNQHSLFSAMPRVCHDIPNLVVFPFFQTILINQQIKPMKKLFIFLMVLIPSALMAQTITIATLHKTGGVQNFIGSLSLRQAVTAASHGDTIYLSGGTFMAPDTINKSLVIIGAGHYPDSTLATGVTLVSTAMVLGENADNSYIEGIRFMGNVTFATDKSVNDLTFRRCRFDLQFIYSTSNYWAPVATCNNNQIIECVFTGSDTRYFGNARSLTISKCLFFMDWRTIENLTASTFINNILFSSNGTYLFNTCYNNQIKNNLIRTVAGYPFSSGTGSYFVNNVCLGFTNTSFLPNVGVNNYQGVVLEGFFLNQDGWNFSYDHDYHLANPGSYPGDDGTQTGIYGTTGPYKDGAVPSNPHVRSKNIAVSTNANGQLEVQIKVAAQQE